MKPEAIVEITVVIVILFLLNRFPKVFGVFVLIGAVIGGYVYSLFEIDSAAIVGKAQMRATIFSPDSPDGVAVENIDIPFHTQRQLLVRVKAAGLNPSNYKIIFPRIPFLRHLRKGKFVIGYDVAGEVVNVGNDKMCDGFKKGDKVYGLTIGTLAEYAVLVCDFTSVKPKDLTYAEAAGLPVVALTTIYAYDVANLESNQNVLVIGASGGCGTYGVLLAKLKDSKVTAICSTKNIDYVKGLGADTIVDYRNPSDMDKLKASGQTFDVIYDTVTSFDPLDPNYEPVVGHLLKHGGTYVSINALPLDWIRALTTQFFLRPLFGMNIQRANHELFLLVTSRNDIERLTSYYDNGSLEPKVVIDSTFNGTDLSDVRKAMQQMMSRRTVGKIIMLLDKDANEK